MRRAGSLITGLAVFSSVALAAQSSNRIETVQKLLAARRQGDLEAARGMLARDAKIWFDMTERKGPGEPWTLNEDDWDRWDRFFHARTEFTDWKDDGDRVTAVGHEINDYYRLLDWKPKPLNFTWWFDASGKIAGHMFHEITGLPPPQRRLDEFKQWARENRPAELAFLMPKDHIDPSGDRPQRWRAILIEWRKAVGLPEVVRPLPANNTTTHG
jgi:hypothetical protein